MTDCFAQVRLFGYPHAPIHVTFDAPDLSSDGGVIPLRRVDDQTGISRGFAACLGDDRDASKVLHDRLEQVRQRVFGIAAGYEDCNDADSLRHDPAFKTACDRAPKDEAGLSSQPTLSRFENAADWPTVRRLLAWLEDSYVEALPKDTEVVVLDIDTTADPTHGGQQLAFFHGFYDTHMFHPVLVFDGQTGQLITAVLRPGNTHAARGSVGILSRIIRSIRQRLPRAQIVVRGDSGFCVPRVLDALEALDAELGDVDYVLGLARNQVLERMLAGVLEQAKLRHLHTGRRARLFAGFEYAAKTWQRPRWVVAKAEHSSWGPNPRFLLTSLKEFPPRLIYDRAYCPRGQCENFIKDFKNALLADRLSCSKFSANFFRLLLHAAAYRLMHALRLRVQAIDPTLGSVQFDTLRLRLLKVAAIVRQSVRRIWFQLPRTFPWAKIYWALVAPPWQLAMA